MKRKEILAQINEIFITTLDNSEINIEETTQATDIDEWNSLTHIMLVVAIEKQFKIQFTSSEIQGWDNVREMLDCINSKL